MKKNVNGKNIAIWGLSFKPNTDDIRFAPSLYIIKNLLQDGYHITAYDPAAMENVRRILKDQINYAGDPYEAANGADALCVLTEWNEFMQADLLKVKAHLKVPLIIDGRNIYQPNTLKNLGFTYISTGRKSL